jgi:hypothetical protein
VVGLANFVEGISGNSGGRGVQVTCGQMMKKLRLS